MKPFLSANTEWREALDVCHFALDPVLISKDTQLCMNIPGVYTDFIQTEEV